MNNICIIPARSGSKRIKNKNIINFFGKPLIYWSILAAKKSRLFSKIYISTDSKKIINLTKKYKVDFLERSKKNSSDNASVHSVIRESILKLQNNGIMLDNICCILPTAVLINYRNLIKSFKMFKKNRSKFLTPVVRFSYPPQRGLILKRGLLTMLNSKNFNKKSQSLKSIYHDAGQYTWGTASNYMNINNPLNNKSSYIILKEINVQDIDNYEDLKIAKIKFKKKFS